MATSGREILLGNVVEQRAANAERPALQRDLNLALRCNLGGAVAKQADDVRRIERRADRDHRARLRDAMRGGEHRGAAQTMTDQNRGRGERLAQMVGRGDQIVDVGRKGGVGKLAFAGAEPGEIEPQHGDAVKLQAVGDVACGPVVLAAGEAMRKQRDRACRPIRPVEQRGKLLALGIGKIEFFGRHRTSFVRQGTPVSRIRCSAIMQNKEGPPARAALPLSGRGPVARGDLLPRAHEPVTDLSHLAGASAEARIQFMNAGDRGDRQ